MITDSIFYVVCSDISCKESGVIKKNCSKCTKCKQSMSQLSLSLLNKFYCPNGAECQIQTCKLLHPSKKHISPPYISPCKKGNTCENTNCLFLHPNSINTCWSVRV